MADKMNGIEAAAWGSLHSGVSVATGYPGGPVTGVIETLLKNRTPGLHIEWSASEKDAVACALGASLVGRRSLAVVKHVGMNVAADAVMTASLTGVKGGFLIVLGADPGGIVSQNEMDDRFFAPLFGIPMIEPCTPGQVYEMTRLAFTVSERRGLPVLLRLSSAFLNNEPSEVSLEPAVKAPVRNARFAPRQEHVSLGTFIMEANRARHDRLSAAEQDLRHLYSLDAAAPNDLGIITTGPTLTTVRTALSEAAVEARVLSLGLIYPIPEALLNRFAKDCRHILVVEEIEPYLEERLRAVSPPVWGKLTGDLPREGALDKRDVVIAVRRVWTRMNGNSPDVELRSFEERARTHSSRNVRPRYAPGCPIEAGHRALRQALDRMRNPLCIGGVGVVSWGSKLPFENLYSTCCMGISPSVVSGMYHAGSDYEELIAVMGDSSFLHSGVQSLMNAVWNGSRMSFILFDNRHTAETGGQPNPGSGLSAAGAPSQAVALLRLVEAVGVRKCRQVSPFETEKARDAILQSTDEEGVSVVILSAPCPDLCCGRH